MRIRNGFEEFFSLRSNLSYDNIYFFLKARSENGYGFYGSGLKKTGVENDIFGSEIGSGFGGPGGTTPTKNSQEYPPPRLFSLYPFHSVDETEPVH